MNFTGTETGLNITLVDSLGDTLFTISHAEHPIEVGHIIHYSFEVDENEFNAENLAYHKALHDTEWRVTKVEHNFRRTAWNRTHHSAWATVTPVNGKAHEFACRERKGAERIVRRKKGKK